MSDADLQRLFKACDKNGTGRIGPHEFRELCVGFEINPTDSDSIFYDLDHDGDGQVTLDDFAWGFREFLTPGSRSRRSSSQAGGCIKPEGDEEYERCRKQAGVAWSQLVNGIGDGNGQQLLGKSTQKLAELYEDLHTTERSSSLVTRFEAALNSLLQDIQKLHDDNKNMKEKLTREKETHVAHLRSLEDELDFQVTRVAAQARQEAQTYYESEKRALIEKTQMEIGELQAHLKLFQKLNAISCRNNTKQNTQQDSVDTRPDLSFENRELRNTLAEARTNLALVQSEMAQLRSDYEDKCRQLNSQQETVVTFINQNDHVHHQLNLLQKANSKLQDTNDNLLSVVDNGWRTARSTSPCICSSAGSGYGNFEQQTKWASQPKTGTVLDAESLIDSGPTSLEVQFKVQSLMEDWDSGRSTMRDRSTGDVESDKSLQEELLQIADWDHKRLQADELDSGIDLSHPIIIPGPLNESYNSMSVAHIDPTRMTDRTYKIVFAGDASVGKSSFIHRFCKGIFVHSLSSTLGVDFQVKTIQVDKRNVTLQLWDTAGQERFRSMTKTYFRRADGVMLLYDITNESSFINVRQWVESIDEVSEKRIPIVLCGNKVDRRIEYQNENLRCVTTEEGEQLAQEHGAIFLESSSKNGANILDAVLALTREMLTIGDDKTQTSAMQITKEQQDPKKISSTCCS